MSIAPVEERFLVAPAARNDWLSAQELRRTKLRWHGEQLRASDLTLAGMTALGDDLRGLSQLVRVDGAKSF